jgi:hypothetical protein
MNPSVNNFSQIKDTMTIVGKTKNVTYMKRNSMSSLFASRHFVYEITEFLIRSTQMTEASKVKAIMDSLDLSKEMPESVKKELIEAVKEEFLDVRTLYSENENVRWMPDSTKTIKEEDVQDMLDVAAFLTKVPATTMTLEKQRGIYIELIHYFTHVIINLEHSIWEMGGHRAPCKGFDPYGKPSI